MDDHDEHDREGDDTRALRGTLTFLALAVGSAIPLTFMARRYPELLDLSADPYSTKAHAALDATGDDLARLRTGLALDTGFAVFYGIVLFFVCSVVPARMVRYRRAGRTLGWLAAVAAVADIVENGAMARMIGEGDGALRRPVFAAIRTPGDVVDFMRTAADDQAAVVRLEYAFWIKWALVVVPLLFAIGAVTTWAAGRAKAPTRHAGALRSALDAVKHDTGGWAPARFHLPERSSWWRSMARWATVPERPHTHLDPPQVARRAPDNPTGEVGICFSGGGIRSAAYNLGALQELQAAGVLGRADYLAAVSGGSYMAGAYSIAATCTSAEALDDVPPFAPGTPEEQYLRNRTNYLVPGALGFAYALWRLVRGLMLNVAFVALLLFLVARPYGWLLQDRLVATTGGVCPSEQVAAPQVPLGEWRETPGTGACRDVEFRSAPWAAVAVGVLGGLALLLGVVDLLLRPQEKTARRLEQWSLRLFFAAVAALVLLFVLPALGAKLLDDAGRGETSQERVVWGSATLGVLTSMIGALVAVYRAGPGKATTHGGVATGPSLVDKARKGLGKVAMGTQNLLLILAGAVLGPLALLAGALAIAIGGVFARLTPEDLGRWLLVLAVVVAVQGIGDINRWSVHPFYKRRLQTAFALRRCGDRDHAYAEEIRFNHRITFPHLLDSPKLLVCAAVNVTNQGLVAPGRPVSTFTFCRTEVDAGLLGRVGTRTYATLLGAHYDRDFTVPAAVAASGAAFSPVMGKMTKPHLRFLLALANLRLGVWLPNPARVRQWAADLQPTLPDTELPPELAAERERAAAALAAAEAQAAEVRAAVDDAVARVRSDLKDRLEVAAAGGMTEEQVDVLRRTTARRIAAEEAKATTAELAVERARREMEEAFAEEPAEAEVTWDGFPWVPRPTLLLRELFGRFRADSRFVYVTDGGHYENLGLVELIRRGCTEIYCFDAAGDQLDAYNTLADALSLARTELGVDIAIDPTPIATADGEIPNATDHVVGRVYYPGAEDKPGVIVFAKLAVTKGIPPDVQAWRAEHPRFPTDGTDDQLYTDQRFEAYRALGSFTAVRAIAAMDEAHGRTPVAAPAPLRPT